MKSAHKSLAALLSVLLLAGCSGVKIQPSAEYAPIRPVVPPPAPIGNGSIYQSGYDVAWFEDIRAHRVGDLLTVTLTENTSANKRSTSGVTKSNDLSIGSPTLFGAIPTFNVPGFVPLDSNRNNTLEVGLNSSAEFDGEGSASQSNALTGNITVTVVEVMPNGNLYVRGEKRIGINQGTEYIRLSGIVRPQDISPQNYVESTRIADPTITYEGDGMVADATNMGWLSRFFTSVLSPF